MRSRSASIQKRARVMAAMFVLLPRIDGGKVPVCRKKMKERAWVEKIRYAEEHSRSYRNGFVENDLTKDSKKSQSHSQMNCVSSIGSRMEVIYCCAIESWCESGAASSLPVNDRLHFDVRESDITGAVVCSTSRV